MQECNTSSTLSFKKKQEIVKAVQPQKYSEEGLIILEAFIFDHFGGVCLSVTTLS